MSTVDTPFKARNGLWSLFAGDSATLGLCLGGTPSGTDRTGFVAVETVNQEELQLWVAGSKMMTLNADTSQPALIINQSADIVASFTGNNYKIDLNSDGSNAGINFSGIIQRGGLFIETTDLRLTGHPSRADGLRAMANGTLIADGQLTADAGIIVTGNAQVTGGTVYSQNASNPGNSQTIWVDTSGDLYYGATQLNTGGGGGAVDSVFGRTGNVVAENGDYGSDFITNESTVSGLNVTGALEYLESIIPTTYVQEFNGRSGVVDPLAGDYDSDMIANLSTVPAVDVTGALDVLAASIPTIYVASFNGRTGTVVAASGDYGSDLITNQSSVSGATVSDALDTLSAGGGGVSGPGSSVVNGVAAWADTSGDTLKDVGGNADNLVYIGRGALGYNGLDSDNFIMAHRDFMNGSQYGFGQAFNGNTIVNTIAGGSILFRNNDSNVARVENNGVVLYANKYYNSPDGDSTHYFGRAAVGHDSVNTDQAAFAHRDHIFGLNYALRQTANGTTLLNAPSGSSGVYFRIQNTSYMQLTSNNLDLKLSTSITSVDTDTTHTLGRAAIGPFLSTDTACFSHRDHNGSSGYALAQNSAGDTIINAVNGRAIYFRNNNSTLGYWDTTSLVVGAGITGTVTGDVNLLLQGNYSNRVQVYLDDSCRWYYEVKTPYSQTEVGRITGTAYVAFAGAANNTTSNAANTYVNTGDGQLQRSTSSRKYKEDIEYDIDHTIIDRLKPASWTDKGDGSKHIGLIAEDVHEVESRLVVYDNDEPEALQYDHFVAPVVAKLQDHEARISALEAA